MTVQTICISPQIRMRREFFGGLLYDRRNGNIIEIDNEAFFLLCHLGSDCVNQNALVSFLSDNDLINASPDKIREVIDQLLQLDIIQSCGHEQTTHEFTFILYPEVQNHYGLSAPETVHWAITYDCDQGCPDCYASRFIQKSPALNTKESLMLIDKLADWGVFQLAIGGGEPFLRDDLPDLVHHAASRGLDVHLTTGLTKLHDDLLKQLSPSVKVLSLGIRSDHLRSEMGCAGLREWRMSVQNAGMLASANLILSRSVLTELPEIIDRLVETGFIRIVLLRYKPPANIDRWKQERPKGEELKSLHAILARIVDKYPFLHLRVDCALSFVQRHLSPELASRLGLKGCVAAHRILAVAPDGSVYPCSQLVHERCYGGNLLESDPKELWDGSKTLQRYRTYQIRKSFKQSACGICLKKASCGGCRVFADDGLGGDPGCPQPVFPPIRQLGKNGRRVDLQHYMKENYSIPVRSYMQRYGVGQSTAVKELNRSPDVVSMSGKRARRLDDEFLSAHVRNIVDIQDTIGYTSGGVPFMSYEEIEQGQEDWDYPLWLQNDAVFSSASENDKE
ncbi:radical SAM protein [candidate division KSB1 bacterium]|nr:radical SAM protein [candidate division KSB1 bacterium]